MHFLSAFSDNHSIFWFLDNCPIFWDHWLVLLALCGCGSHHCCLLGMEHGSATEPAQPPIAKTLSVMTATSLGIADHCDSGLGLLTCHGILLKYGVRVKNLGTWLECCIRFSWEYALIKTKNEMLSMVWSELRSVQGYICMSYFFWGAHDGELDSRISVSYIFSLSNHKSTNFQTQWMHCPK